MNLHRAERRQQGQHGEAYKLMKYLAAEVGLEDGAALVLVDWTELVPVLVVGTTVGAAVVLVVWEPGTH